MSDAESDAPRPAPAVPAWLEPLTLYAMQAAVQRALAWDRSAQNAAETAREVVRAHMPAATMAMLAEAVAAVLLDPEGIGVGVAAWRGEPLAEASPEEVAASLSYAMQFNERGKARRTGHEYTASMAAGLELTRFCGHRHAFDGGVPHGQNEAPVRTGVPAADHRVGPSRARLGEPRPGVRAVGTGDSKLGRPGRPAGGPRGGESRVSRERRIVDRGRAR